jgi:hypothetical protein
MNLLIWVNSQLAEPVASTAAIATGLVIAIYFASAVIKFVQSILE